MLGHCFDRLVKAERSTRPPYTRTFPTVIRRIGISPIIHAINGATVPVELTPQPVELHAAPR
jgi:hypothetical protein